MVFLEYRKVDTPMHNMRVMTKLCIYVTVLLLASFYWDFAYLLPLMAVGAILYVLANTPGKWLLITIPIMIYKGTEYFLYGLAQSSAALYHLPYAGNVIFQFTVPLLGPISLTYGGLSWTISNTLRIPLLCLLSFAFIYSTNITDLIKTLASLKVPSL